VGRSQPISPPSSFGPANPPAGATRASAADRPAPPAGCHLTPFLLHLFPFSPSSLSPAGTAVERTRPCGHVRRRGWLPRIGSAIAPSIPPTTRYKSIVGAVRGGGAGLGRRAHRRLLHHLHRRRLPLCRRAAPPLFTDAFTSARSHLGETILPHSSVDAPAFEPRGNAVSAAALALCDAGLRARLGHYLAGVAAVIPHARRCLSYFLFPWTTLPCAATLVRHCGRAAGMRTPMRLRNPVRHRTAVHPRTRARLP
jgi:hypothetical protein